MLAACGAGLDACGVEVRKEIERFSIESTKNCIFVEKIAIMKKDRLINTFSIKLFLSALSLFLCSKTFAQTVHFEPAFLPVVFSYDFSTNTCSAKGSAGINTRIGRVSLDFTNDLLKKRKSSETVNVGNTSIKREDLIIIVRNMRYPDRQDDIYVIKGVEYYSYSTKGNVDTQGKEGELIIVINDDTGSFNITIYDNSTRVETQQKGNTTTYNISDLTYEAGYYRVISEKSFFHNNEWHTMNGSRTNNYILQGTVVYVEKISRTNLTEYVTFTHNGVITKGWLIMKHLSKKE